MVLAENVTERFTYPESDPALSDAISQEMRVAMLRRNMRARAIATTEPFNPEAFLEPNI